MGFSALVVHLVEGGDVALALHLAVGDVERSEGAELRGRKVDKPRRQGGVPYARAACFACARISLRIRSSRGSVSRSTNVIAAPTAGWTRAISA